MAGSMEARARAVIFDSRRNLLNLNLANGTGKWSFLPRMKDRHAPSPSSRNFTKIPGILHVHTCGLQILITEAEKKAAKIGVYDRN